MSEHDMAVSTENLNVNLENIAPLGAGAMLRMAREAQGLPLEMLAATLKVPINKLETLEADRLDLLPDTVFVRAVASSMCRVLKIDVAPILAALPHSHAPKIKSDADGLNTTFEDVPGGYGQKLLSHLHKPLGLSILLLLAGILVLVFLPVSTSFENISAVFTGDQSEVAPAASDETFADPAPAVSLIAQTPSAPLALADTSQIQSLVPIPSAATVVQKTPPLTVSSDRVLTLQALGSSWAEVVDAKGVVQLRKLLTKDEIITVSGALPLAVVLGRADLVSVMVRGQALDTASLANDNVARFEVK